MNWIRNAIWLKNQVLWDHFDDFLINFLKREQEIGFVYISRTKMSSFQNKSQKTPFLGKKCTSDNFDFCSSLSLPPGCVGGERGMGLKFGGKGKQFRLKISSEKLHQIGA